MVRKVNKMRLAKYIEAMSGQFRCNVGCFRVLLNILGIIHRYDCLMVRYKENMPLVLHGVSCTLPGGKNIGIVGCTGSGKSTLIQALFRLIEPSGGSILIDSIALDTITSGAKKNIWSCIRFRFLNFEALSMSNAIYIIKCVCVL